MSPRNIKTEHLVDLHEFASYLLSDTSIHHVDRDARTNMRGTRGRIRRPQRAASSARATPEPRHMCQGSRSSPHPELDDLVRVSQRHLQHFRSLIFNQPTREWLGGETHAISLVDLVVTRSRVPAMNAHHGVLATRCINWLAGETAPRNHHASVPSTANRKQAHAV